MVIDESCMSSARQDRGIKQMHKQIRTCELPEVCEGRAGASERKPDQKGPVGERAGEPADTGAEAEGGRAAGKVSGAGTACAGIMR